MRRLRILLSAALFLLISAAIVWATEPFNTSGRWACFSGTCIIGSSRAPAIQLQTDGTGNGEIVLPTGAISTTEVTDDSLTFADISNSSAIDETTYFTAADTISLELIPTATAGDTDFFVINANQTDDANATDDFRAMVMELTSESGDAGDTFGGLSIEWENGTANTVIDYAIKIDNEETTGNTMTDGILITSSGAATGVWDAIDVSASNIVNAINIGDNSVLGANGDSMTIGLTDNTLRLNVTSGADAVFRGEDSDGNGNTIFDTVGAGAITVGSADVTSVTLTTDGNGDDEVVLPAGSVSVDEMTDPAPSNFTICGEATTVNNNTVYYGPDLTLTTTNNGLTCDINAAGDTTEANVDEPVYTNQAMEVWGMTCRNEGDANADISYTLRTAAGATVPSVTCTIADGERDCVADVQTTTDIAAAATVAIAAASSSDIADNNGFVCQVFVNY